MTTTKTELTQARLKELLHYDPETGHFTWIKSTSNRAPVGERAGHLSRNGYVDIRVDGLLRRGHRLAWLYQTGAVPSSQLDHINRDRSDNRWRNLREVSHTENARNLSLSTRNSSGVRGVCWAPREKKWRAYGFADGKQVPLGYFDDLVAAGSVAKRWRDDLHGAYAGA